LVEGEWGVLQVKLNRPSKFVAEGDIESLDRGEARGVVEIPMKPRKPGMLPVAIIAKNCGKEEVKII